MDTRKIIDDLLGVSLSFLTPYYKQGRGNATTARRIMTGLGQTEMNTNVVAYDEQSFSRDLVETIKKSDLLHVLHFRRFAEWLEKNDYQVEKPYVITSGGTDVNIDIFSSEYKEKIGQVLRNATAITVFSDDAKQKLAEVYPEVTEKVHIVKQSVWFPHDASSNSTVSFAEVGPNILLPAGLRPVKDVLFVLPALVKLKEQFPTLTFTILGAPLEQSVVKAVRQAQEKYPWIDYFEEVALEEMEGVYLQSDIIINTSLSEGQSSALLEAMFLGKPVVARNNGGNQSIVTHGKTGFLFEDGNEFYEQIKLLLTKDEIKEGIALNGRKYVEEHHSLNEEIESYLNLYLQILK